MLELIRRYYELRGYAWPSPLQALFFVLEELGEWGREMNLGPDFVRNNPQNQILLDEAAAQRRKAKEWHDVLFMWIVIGRQSGYIDGTLEDSLRAHFNNALKEKGIKETL